jgi:hypothetical protein
MDCCMEKGVLLPRLRCDNYVQAKSRQTQDARSSMFSFSSHMGMAVLRDVREREEVEGKRTHDLVCGGSGPAGWYRSQRLTVGRLRASPCSRFRATGQCLQFLDRVIEGKLRIVVKVSCRSASHDHFPEAQDVRLGAFGGEGSS